MLKGLELKRDMETLLVGVNIAKVTGSDSTARKTASILSWIKSNTSKGAGGRSFGGGRHRHPHRRDATALVAARRKAGR